MTVKQLVEMLSGYSEDLPVKTLCGELPLDVQSVNSQKDENEEFILIW